MIIIPDEFQNLVGFFGTSVTGSHILEGSCLHLLRGFTPKIPKTVQLYPPRVYLFLKKKLLSALDEGRPDEVG